MQATEIPFLNIHCSPACAMAVLIDVVFSGGAVLTPSSTALALPEPMPLQTSAREVSACTERALATYTNTGNKAVSQVVDSSSRMRQ